jgi:hypothetical protein
MDFFQDGTKTRIGKGERCLTMPNMHTFSAFA